MSSRMRPRLPLVTNKLFQLWVLGVLAMVAISATAAKTDQVCHIWVENPKSQYAQLFHGTKTPWHATFMPNMEVGLILVVVAHVLILKRETERPGGARPSPKDKN